MSEQQTVQNQNTKQEKPNVDPQSMEQSRRSPDVLLYSDLYKNAMMGADSCAKMIAKVGAAAESQAPCDDGKLKKAENCTALRSEITKMMEGYSRYAKDAAKALNDLQVPPEQLSALDKLPADIGMTMQTMFDKSVSKCAEIMINGVTMGIIDMKKAQRVCSEDGCSAEAYRMAGDLIGFCEMHVENLKEYL
ncbi:MAG: hypothetical protein IJC98_04035 [Clostridia bacterium]|nr:hypothetical protein [Clostridia bacterium]